MSVQRGPLSKKIRIRDNEVKFLIYLQGKKIVNYRNCDVKFHNFISKSIIVYRFSKYNDTIGRRLKSEIILPTNRLKETTQTSFLNTEVSSHQQLL